VVDCESLPAHPEAVRKGAEERARRHVDEVLAALDGGGGVAVEVRASFGAPWACSPTRRKAAALLVVGHRGRGAFRSMAFGSVGTGASSTPPPR
jgi:nucleotide-binding universal stress UspA family protein